MAKLVPAFLVGGCSLIYNPSNIDKPMTDARLIDMGEVAIDVEIRADAMPRDLVIMEAFPTTIDEGSGTGGSRAAVVVLRGHNFVKDAAANLVVTIAPATTGAAVLDSYEVSGNGDYIALAVSVPVDTACADGTTVNVGVTVKQNDLIGGDIMQTLDNAFAVRCLDELDAAPAAGTSFKERYSRIVFSTALDLSATSAAAIPAAILRSASLINIGTLDVSADGRNPGPGGGIGGAANNNPGTGLRPGLGGGSLGGNGGGAGFIVMGGTGANGGLGGAGGAGGGTTGDPWLASYGTNASSGGGGAGAGATGNGGVGGGGGGTLELSAPGDVTVGAITADGAAGATGTGGGGAGGSGTGGVVLVRAGNMLTLPSVSVAKGAQTGSAGTSSDGRVRVDAAKGAYPTGPTSCVTPFSATCNLTKGPMFVDMPTRTTTQMLPISLRGTANDATATLRVFDKAGNAVMGPLTSTYTPTFGTTGAAMVMPTLKAGYNRVCVWVAGGVESVPESVNCQDVAYLPL